ncbi:MAG: flagellar biosynthetic protein FliR [Acidobacteria bacterium]|nr:flagellar biosynthetic protein FliR [Acidobacteriota bacterium]
MRAELTLPLSTLYGFLLVLARVAGAFVFVPLPGVNRGPEMSRPSLALAITVALFPLWPEVQTGGYQVGRLAGWLLAEAALGMTIGLAVGFVAEAFQVAAQLMGMQAGFAYASVIDPTTQADSSVLLVLAQLTAGLLFFSLGLDREVIRIFARSLEQYPPAAFTLSPRIAGSILHLAAGMFSVGLRLALPVVALMALVDLALALFGRLNAQLQLLSLAFPVKILAALALLAWVATLYPRVYRDFAAQSLRTATAVLGF